ARVLDKADVSDWLNVEVVEEVEVEQVQVGPGRPGPATQYTTVKRSFYTIRVEENEEALARAARCDGIFPLLSNDKSLSLKDALEKYKYQPYADRKSTPL